MTKTFEEIFSEPERQIIETCIKFGNFQEVPTQFESNNMPPMTPERAEALEIYLNKHKPVIIDDESEVKKEMETLIAKEELKIDTPEKEAEWQAKLDAERKAKEMKLRGEKMPVEELSKNEIMEKLKEKSVEFKPTQSKSELLDLLEAS